jgi:hypothetical protein
MLILINGYKFETEELRLTLLPLTLLIARETLRQGNYPRIQEVRIDF